MFLQQVKVLFLAGLGMLGGVLFSLSCLGASVDSTALSGKIQGEVPVSSVPVTGYLYVSVTSYNNRVLCWSRGSGEDDLFGAMYVGCPDAAIQSSPIITADLVSACFCQGICENNDVVDKYSVPQHQAPGMTLRVLCRIPLVVQVSYKVAHTPGEGERVILRGQTLYVVNKDGEFRLQPTEGADTANISSQINPSDQDKAINLDQLPGKSPGGGFIKGSILELIPANRWPIKTIFQEPCVQNRNYDPQLKRNRNNACFSSYYR